MVERAQALESEEYGFKPQFFCVIALCPLASHLTSELPASLLKWGWYLHQKTTVRTKCDSTTYLRIELLIVTYVCQFFPSRGRHKGTYFIPLFSVLWIWRFGLLKLYFWILTCVYREYSLGSKPWKSILKSRRVWPFSTVHPLTRQPESTRKKWSVIPRRIAYCRKREEGVWWGVLET